MAKIKCGICLEEFEYLKRIPKGTMVVCQYCSRVGSRGVKMENIRAASIQERKLYEYAPDLEFLFHCVYGNYFSQDEEPQKELKKHSNDEIMHEFYSRGIRATLDYLLHESDPKTLRETRKKAEEKIRKQLREEGKTEEAINKILKI
jgi:hypothetical protein